MPNPRQYRSVSDAIAAQSVGDEGRGLYPRWSRRLKKRLAGLPFRVPLHEDVEHDPALVHCAPTDNAARPGSGRTPHRDATYRPAAVGAGAAIWRKSEPNFRHQWRILSWVASGGGSEALNSIPLVASAVGRLSLGSCRRLSSLRYRLGSQRRRRPRILRVHDAPSCAQSFAVAIATRDGARARPARRGGIQCGRAVSVRRPPPLPDIVSITHFPAPRSAPAGDDETTFVKRCRWPLPDGHFADAARFTEHFAADRRPPPSKLRPRTWAAPIGPRQSGRGCARALSARPSERRSVRRCGGRGPSPGRTAFELGVVSIRERRNRRPRRYARIRRSSRPN